MECVEKCKVVSLFCRMKIGLRGGEGQENLYIEEEQEIGIGIEIRKGKYAKQEEAMNDIKVKL